MANDYNPFDEETQAERGEYSRPKDGQSTYVWKGVELPRVTEILGIAPGNHLMNWYAKVSALRCAASLVHAGLHMPDDKTGAELEKFVDSEAIRVIEPHDAIEQACNWEFNRREPERYRDTRAWIGQLAHHWFYNHALGIRIGDNDRIDWLTATARSLKLVPEYVAKRFETYGKSLDDIETDLAFHALPHIDSGMKFIEAFKPEWEAIGLEAVAISESEGFAGTCDWFAKFKKSDFQKANRGWNYPGQTATIGGDWKTGTESKSHRVQVAAYMRADFIGLVEDHSEHPVPEVDGIAVVYTKNAQEPVFREWIGKETIDALYEGFCGLCAYYRLINDLPKASRSRKFSEPKAKRGERGCPF